VKPFVPAVLGLRLVRTDTPWSSLYLSHSRSSASPEQQYPASHPPPTWPCPSPSLHPRPHHRPVRMSACTAIGDRPNSGHSRTCVHPDVILPHQLPALRCSPPCPPPPPPHPFPPSTCVPVLSAFPDAPTDAPVSASTSSLGLHPPQ
jgi:hypothetical protein